MPEEKKERKKKRKLTSAQKRAKQNEKRRLRNKSYRTRIKNVCKSVEMAVAENNAPKAKDAVLEAIKVLDRCAGKKIIHKNKAARKKSRLLKKVKALEAFNQTETRA